VAEQDEQLLVPAGWTEPSELPKEQTDRSRSTSAALHCGQLTAASLRIRSFSNFLSQDLQRYSKMGMIYVPCQVLRSTDKESTIVASIVAVKDATSQLGCASWFIRSGLAAGTRSRK
jgi:hypothetical protein